MLRKKKQIPRSRNLIAASPMATCTTSARCSVFPSQEGGLCVQGKKEWTLLWAKETLFLQSKMTPPTWANSSRDMACGVLCSIDDIDLDSLLNSHTNSREGHLTGEVGSMVLEPGSEGQH